MKKGPALLLSFFMPAAVFTVVFALYRVAPFGNNNIMFSDMGLQYYPLLTDYLRRIREGRSLLWSWTQGGGADFLTVITYYLASPLNLLLLPVPESVLPNALTFLVVFKIGLAGLFMGIFLTDCLAEKFRRASAPGLASNGAFAIPLFAIFYALSSFAIMRYWVINFLDAFILLPLVILGETALIREGKFKLFIITLSLSIITNFYMGFYTCVFVGITFFTQSFIQKLALKEFLQRFKLIAVCSVIAIGITAILTLPAYIYVTNTGPSSDYNLPGSIAFFNNFSDMTGGFLAFSQNAKVYNLPNLYCGMLCVLLIGPYLGSPKIKHREKAAFVIVSAFLLLSCNINILDYMWNAFRYVHGLFFRYMYVFIFTVVAAMYQFFITVIEDMKRRDLLLMAATAIFVLWAAGMGAAAVNVLPNTAVIAGYLLIFAVMSTSHSLMSKNVKIILKTTAATAFIAVALIETGGSAYKTIDGHILTTWDDYFDNYDEVGRMLAAFNSSGSPRQEFYRVELNRQYNEGPEVQFSQFNDPALFGYNGLSYYSSTIAYGIGGFYDDIGLSVNTSIIYGYNAYSYSLSSPLSAMFLNLRYVISDSASPGDDVFWEIKSETEGGFTLLENKSYLPLGFMVCNDILDYDIDKTNPFITQNNLFCAATGLTGDLFVFSNPAVLNETNLKYDMPKDGSLYIYSDNKAEVMIQTRKTVNRFPYIIPAGYHKKSETVIINHDTTVYYGQKVDELSVFAAVIDEELFDAGYDILADETLEITEFRDTYVRGEITALADGVLYTSIPLSDNWAAYVDGVKTEIAAVGGAMTGLKITAGEHIIEFRYFNKPFAVGAVISLISLGAFVVMWRGLPSRLGRVSAPWAPRNDGMVV